MIAEQLGAALAWFVIVWGVAHIWDEVARVRGEIAAAQPEMTLQVDRPKWARFEPLLRLARALKRTSAWEAAGNTTPELVEDMRRLGREQGFSVGVEDGVVTLGFDDDHAAVVSAYHAELDQ